MPITQINGSNINSNTGSNGVVVSTTGVFINTAYIATLNANNALYLGGVISTSYTNTAGTYTITGPRTHNANITFGTSARLIANGSAGTNGQYLVSNATTCFWQPLISPVSTPANNATGIAGQIVTDGTYLYVCTATNTWKRITLSVY